MTGKNVKEAFNDIFEQLYTKFEDAITGKTDNKSGNVNLKSDKKITKIKRKNFVDMFNRNIFY